MQKNMKKCIVKYIFAGSNKEIIKITDTWQYLNFCVMM